MIVELRAEPITARSEGRSETTWSPDLDTRGNGELHLITICEAADQQRASEHLSEVAASLSLPVKTATVRGTDVEKEVCKYVDRAEADMLFLNSTGEPGPVKRDIIRSAGVPVMIVPAA